MGFYDVNINEVIKDATITEQRTPLTQSWLEVLAAPVRRLKGLFDSFRAASLYEVTHNGQVARMEDVLNDAFDPTDKRIYIDTTLPDEVFIFLVAEDRPEWIAKADEAGTTDYESPMWLFTAEEIAEAPDFTVMVPEAVYDAMPSETRMRALIDKYRVPSKFNYIIETF